MNEREPDININKPVEIKVEDLLKQIKDPSENEGNTIKYKGKLLPSIWCQSLPCEDAEDKQMVSMFLERLGKGEPLIDELQKAWENGGNNFKIASSKQMTEYPTLKQELGIGFKRIRRDDGDGTTKQPEYEEASSERYHPWIHHLINDLSMGHEVTGKFYSTLIETESSPKGPMATTSADTVSMIYNKFSSTQLSMFTSKVANFYSRLGGSYLTDNKKNPNHSNIVVLPLYSVSDNDGKNMRWLEGICVRGPHHATSPTDKINLVLIELLTKKRKYFKYLNHIHNSRFFKQGEDIYCIRQNVILRHDRTFLTFVSNCTFTPINMCGEILENRMINDSIYHLHQFIRGRLWSVVGEKNGRIFHDGHIGRCS